MRTALTNGRLLTDEGIVSGQTVLLADARIEALVDPKDSRCLGSEVIDLGGQLLLPGSPWHRRPGQGLGQDRRLGLAADGDRRHALLRTAAQQLELE